MSETSYSEKNPYQQWLFRIQQVMKEQNASGWVTVRCTDELELYDDAYGYDENLFYTQEEVDWIRCVLLPPEREAFFEEMTRLVLGRNEPIIGHISLDAFRRPVPPANILEAFDVMTAEFKNKRMWSKKLNILFGFTLAIQQYDSWMMELNNHNNGSSRSRMKEMIHEIGNMWNRVLKRSSADLGIDDEFSRPGIECFLHKFQESVGDMNMAFDFF
mmetsp:Transcript_8293/g.14439  ORF Transcript_8293/g.14439 Transcript_8293/m.14439 type:complete len:216 (-) Transcript_8293:186-833(-)|eukprot:CAMPEP_0183734828 /NCGR_PEP_ID=MMETSP0737-20130205/44956_1 /TAXON_ID=385413 /ORGANISM="Thalassiosira miniscula, Strain CCMP1093" /LENGTH=215 /DNA_ID=CAMNT_0025968437 /DNA_START=260 /DNA_END=907 /DNA_ORIENTATION=-